MPCRPAMRLLYLYGTDRSSVSATDSIFFCLPVLLTEINCLIILHLFLNMNLKSSLPKRLRSTSKMLLIDLVNVAKLLVGFGWQCCSKCSNLICLFRDLRQRMAKTCVVDNSKFFFKQF